MATPTAFIAVEPDRLERSVWVVIDPRDFVTGRRMTTPVRVSLNGVTAEPIVGGSGVYCFTDLDLPAGNYTAHVQPRLADRDTYFNGDTTFALVTVPVPAQPLNRNLQIVQLMPRPGYPFGANATLARGRLVRASDGTAVEGARIFLLIGAVDQGRRGQTDERGEFVVPFPLVAPEDTASAGLKDFPFQLRFEIDGQPPHVIPQQTVHEGTAISLHEVQFPGI
jgi:hypothetical protein